MIKKKVSNFLLKSFSNVLAPGQGPEQTSEFLDINVIEPSLNRLIDNFDIIYEDFCNVQEHYNVPSYHEIDEFQKPISEGNQEGLKWSIFILQAGGYISEISSRYCKNTLKHLAHVPNVIQAFYSILEPQKSIPPHFGPYKGYVRFHLGLEVSDDNPPVLIVNKIERPWIKGEGFIFDDTYIHEVRNPSLERRVVLIVDIYRPFKGLYARMNHFVIDKLVKPTYLRKIINQQDELLLGSVNYTR